MKDVSRNFLELITGNLFLRLKIGLNKKSFQIAIFKTKVRIISSHWIWEFFNFSSFEKLYRQFKDLTYNLATKMLPLKP